MLDNKISIQIRIGRVYEIDIEKELKRLQIRDQNQGKENNGKKTREFWNEQIITKNFIFFYKKNHKLEVNLERTIFIVYKRRREEGEKKQVMI